MIRRPPRSTPFPTRRSSDLVGVDEDERAPRVDLDAPQAELRAVEARPARSEEHTSELQSRSDLVCRLLLEKKKKKEKTSKGSQSDAQVPSSRTRAARCRASY